MREFNIDQSTTNQLLPEVNLTPPSHLRYTKVSTNLEALHTHGTISGELLARLLQMCSIDTTSRAVGLLAVLAVYLCFPQAAVTIASNQLTEGWEHLLANNSEKDLFVNGISLCFLVRARRRKPSA